MKELFYKYYVEYKYTKGMKILYFFLILVSILNRTSIGLFFFTMDMILRPYLIFKKDKENNFININPLYKVNRSSYINELYKVLFIGIGIVAILPILYVLFFKGFIRNPLYAIVTYFLIGSMLLYSNTNTSFKYIFIFFEIMILIEIVLFGIYPNLAYIILYSFVKLVEEILLPYYQIVCCILTFIFYKLTIKNFKKLNID